MEYEAAMRGRIQHKPRARQLVDYSGMRFERNITPTDIDGLWTDGDDTPYAVSGLVEFNGREVFIFEFKLAGAKMPQGQRVALERLTGLIEKGGAKAYFIAAQHRHTNVAESIDAAQAETFGVYHGGTWYNGARAPLREVVDLIRGRQWPWITFEKIL